MSLYLDTSALVAALTNEANTARIQAWLAAQNAEELAISDWVVTEFSSALSIKLRSKHLAESHRADAMAAFARLSADSFHVLPVTRAQYRAATLIAGQYGLGLRAGDSLHLAICAEHGAALCTLDTRLNAAGGALGVKTLLL